MWAVKFESGLQHFLIPSSNHLISSYYILYFYISGSQTGVCESLVVCEGIQVHWLIK